MIRLAALLAVSASAASAGGLAPPIVQPVAAFSFITPQAVVERCPVVPTALDSLRAQGFTRLVAEPGSRVARVSAFRDGQWTVVGYDCRSGALLFQDAVAAAEADLVDDGIYILEGTEVDATADLAAGTRLDEIGSVATVSAEADVAAGAGADLASTSVELSNGGGDIVGNGRSGDPSAFTRIDATDAISGGEITEQGF
jgi:hypothetical protein